MSAPGRPIPTDPDPEALRASDGPLREAWRLLRRDRLATAGLVILEEVKGSRGWKLDDEGRTKWKIAGELWPLFVFRGVILRKGVWTTEEYKPRGPWL